MQAANTVLELQVANHPGVMSHVVGLFSRRLFNLEGILCLPVGDGRYGCIWLMVNEDARLPQLVRQLERLEDVVLVRRHPAGHSVLLQLTSLWESALEASPCPATTPASTAPHATS